MSTTKLDNQAIVEGFIEMLNNHNFKQAHNLIAENAINHAGGMGDFRGIEAWKMVASQYFSAFPDLKVNIEFLLSEGDYVVIRLKYEGTHLGEMMGIPPTGKTVKVGGTEIYYLENGRIAEEWGQQDNLGLLQQIGAIPALTAH